MVDLNVTSEIGNSLSGLNWANLIGGIPGISGLVTIGKAVGIAVLVYIIFLIIRSITQILYSRRFGKLTKNVEEINHKMDILISKSGREEAKKKKK